MLFTRKAPTFIAAVLLVALFVTACGSKAPTPNPVNPQNTQANAAASTAYPAATNVPPAQPAYPIATPVAATQPAYPSPATIGSPLTVTRPDNTTTSLTPDTLVKLTMNTVQTGSTSVQGIALSAILIAAGITDYKQVTLTGANGSQTLAKDKVTDKVILKINDDKTLQLVSPDLPEANWLKAVSTIKVE